MKRLVITGVLLLIFASAGFASDAPASEEAAREIYSETMSPFCPGRLLNDCPSSAAHDLKVKIREKLNSGESKQDVFQYLVSLYGDEIRAAPQNEGFGRAAWLATPIFVLLGFASIILVLKKSKASEAIEPAVKLDPEIQRRIQNEMEN